MLRRSFLRVVASLAAVVAPAVAIAAPRRKPDPGRCARCGESATGAVVLWEAMEPDDAGRTWQVFRRYCPSCGAIEPSGIRPIRGHGTGRDAGWDYLWITGPDGTPRLIGRRQVA
jgi:hypothetical protein